MPRLEISLWEVKDVLRWLESTQPRYTFFTPGSFGIVIGVEEEVGGEYGFRAIKRIADGEHGGQAMHDAEALAGIAAKEDEDLGMYASREGYGVASTGFESDNLLVSSAILEIVLGSTPTTYKI